MIKKLLILFAALITFKCTASAFEMSEGQMLVNPLNSSPEIQAYTLQVGQKIITNFNMPNTQENLSAVVIFKVDKNGKLMNYEITQKSGSEDYDNRVVTAIKKSSPYPIPTFQDPGEVGIILNMDLSIIRLIKMLQGNSNPNQQQFQPNLEPHKGKKFVNPYDYQQ